MEVLGCRSHQQGRHGSAEAESLHANLVGFHIGQALQPFGPFDKITDFNGTQLLINSVQAFATVVAGGAAVGDKLYDAVLGIPAVAGRVRPPVKDLGRIGTAVNVHVDRIFLGRIEAFRIVNDAGQFQPIHGNGYQLSGGTVIAALTGNEFGLALKIVQAHLPRSLEVGSLGDEMLAVRSERSAQYV